MKDNIITIINTAHSEKVGNIVFQDFCRSIIKNELSLKRSLFDYTGKHLLVQFLMRCELNKFLFQNWKQTTKIEIGEQWEKLVCSGY